MAAIALGVWIQDNPIKGSVVRLKDIETPRKRFEEYEEGDVVELRCRGFKGMHKCLLGKIGEEKDKQAFQTDLAGEGFIKILKKFNLHPETELEKVKESETAVGQQENKKTVKEKRKQDSEELSKTTPKKRKSSTPKKRQPATFFTSLEKISAELDLTELQKDVDEKLPQPNRPESNESACPDMDNSDNQTSFKISEVSAFKPLPNGNTSAEGKSLNTAISDIYGETMRVVIGDEHAQGHNRPPAPSCNCEEQLSQIWAWLGTLEQRTSWMMSRVQMQPYQMMAYNDSGLSSPSLSAKSVDIQTPPNATPSASGTSTPAAEEEAVEDTSQQEQLYGSFTKSQLLAKVNTIKDFGKAAKLLFRLLYTENEYKGRSLSGGRPNAKYEQRPPIEDTTKLHVIYDIIKEKFGTAEVQVKDKIRELLKPSRAK